MSLHLDRPFCRFELRTIDVVAARAFYNTLLDDDRATIWPLHEQARARGAVPHWLGHVNIGDPEQLIFTLREFAARGATPLGPTIATDDRGHFAVIRDPAGAILALAAPPNPMAPPMPEVAWSVLNTSDALTACTNYHELLGWDIAEVATASPHGPYREFSYNAGLPRVGAIADIAGRPEVHPHWLHFFRVASVDEAMMVTRRAGGTAFDAGLGPSGEYLAVCEDPQGAAFGVMQR